MRLVSDSLPPKVCPHKFKEKKKRNPIECVAVILFYSTSLTSLLSCPSENIITILKTFC